MYLSRTKLGAYLGLRRSGRRREKHRDLVTRAASIIGEAGDFRSTPDGLGVDRRLVGLITGYDFSDRLLVFLRSNPTGDRLLFLDTQRR